MDLMLAGCGNAGKAFCKDYKLIKQEEEMTHFSKGDIVEPCDGSGVVAISEDGRLDYGVHGIHINRRKFEILATKCELPVKVCSGLDLKNYDKNDLILRSLDNNQIIFITSTQVRLAHRCNTCPSCGEKI